MSVTNAKDPSTPSASLGLLGQRDDADILMALTENPNTPLDLLYVLAELFPHLFWRNPVLSLLLLEDPSFLSRSPATTQEALVESASAPGWFLASMTEHHSISIRAMALRHPGLPQEQMEVAASSREDSARKMLAANPRLPRSLALRLLQDEESSVAVAVVKQFPFEEQELSWLWHKDDPWLHRALAENPHTTASTLTRLAQIESASYLSIIASHPNADAPLLEGLSTHIELQKEVASHLNTSRETLLALKRNSSSEVRRRVLCNPNTPTQLGDQMARDEPSLLHSTASVSASLLESFLLSKEEPLRRSAAFHPKSPPHLLSRLANDESLRVQCAVAGNTSTPPSTLELLATAGSIRIIAALAQNPKTPSMLLWSLTKSGDQEVRVNVASNPSVSGWGVRELAQDSEREVRLALCKNSSVMMGDLLCLRRDKDGAVKRAAKAAIRVR